MAGTPETSNLLANVQPILKGPDDSPGEVPAGPDALFENFVLVWKAAQSLAKTLRDLGADPEITDTDPEVQKAVQWFMDHPNAFGDRYKE